jgi:hypothetical protein
MAGQIFFPRGTFNGVVINPDSEPRLWKRIQRLFREGNELCVEGDLVLAMYKYQAAEGYLKTGECARCKGYVPLVNILLNRLVRVYGKLDQETISFSAEDAAWFTSDVLRTFRLANPEPEP